MAVAAQTTPLSHRVLRDVAMIGLAVGTFCLLWQAVIVAFALPPYMVPSPWSVAKSFSENRAMLLGQAALTLGSAALGLLISTIFAILLAVAFVANRLTMQATMPLVIALRSLPVVAIAPIVMLLVGRGIGTSVVVVVIISFFPMLVNLLRGLFAIDRNAIELLRVYGASRTQQLRLLRIPFAMPFLFTGLRIAAANALLGAMLSEWITGSKGLGYLILRAGELREIEQLWAAVLTIVAIALVIFRATSAGERALLYWRG
jgi:ABC-type nitrate/sulfonate/bicarbonate transport system permease component